MKQLVLHALTLLKIFLFEASLFAFYYYEFGLILLLCCAAAYFILEDRMFSRHYKLYSVIALLPIIIGGVVIHYYATVGLSFSLLFFLLSESKWMFPAFFLSIGVTIAYCCIDYFSIVYSVHPYLIIPILVCLIIPAISFALFFITRYSVHFYGIRIYLRVLSLYSIYVGLIFLAIVPLGYIYLIRGIVDLTFDNIVEFGVIGKIFLVMLDKADDIKSPFVHFFRIKNDNILLFLRRFSYDEQDDPCLSSLSSYLCQPCTPRYTILKIADPSTFYCYASFGCEYLYLPTIDWKQSLNLYIERAKLVVMVLNHSEGVLWEAFEHFDHKEKYIYYLPSLIQLNTIINDNIFIERNYEKTPLGLYLLELNTQLEEDRISIDFPTYFYFEKDKIVMGYNIADIVEMKSKNL